MIQISRQQLINNLTAYGEEIVASKVMDLPEQKFNEIQKLAFDYACQPTSKKSGGMLLAKACSLAAVEIIEGSRRDLSRRKRTLVKKSA